MTKTLDIDIPQTLLSISSEELQKVISVLLKDYTEFDMHLLQKYIEVRDLPDSRFVNL